MARPVETIVVIKNGDLCSTLPEKNEGCETGCVCGVDSECIGLCPYYDCDAHDAPCFVDTLTKMCKRDPQVLTATPGLVFRERDLLEQNRLYLNNNKKMLYAGAAKNPTAWRTLMTEWKLLTPNGDRCDDTYLICGVGCECKHASTFSYKRCSCGSSAHEMLYGGYASISQWNDNVEGGNDAFGSSSSMLIGGVVGASAVVVIMLIFCIGLAFGIVIYWGYSQKRTLDVKRRKDEMRWIDDEDRNDV
eukprot:775792_1